MLPPEIIEAIIWAAPFEVVIVFARTAHHYLDFCKKVVRARAPEWVRQTIGLSGQTIDILPNGVPHGNDFRGFSDSMGSIVVTGYDLGRPIFEITTVDYGAYKFKVSESGPYICYEIWNNRITEIMLPDGLAINGQFSSNYDLPGPGRTDGKLLTHIHDHLSSLTLEDIIKDYIVYRCSFCISNIEVEFDGHEVAIWTRDYRCSFYTRRLANWQKNMLNNIFNERIARIIIMLIVTPKA